MSKVKKETLDKSYKPYDIVTDKNGNVGFIQEVSVNESQDNFESQISYSIEWLVGSSYNAWHNHDSLKRHCNLFVMIAKASCHPFGNNEKKVVDLFNSDGFV